MSRDDPQFKLRMTEELRDQIAEAARANNRSMNAEIIGRLEDSFAAKGMDDMTIKDVINQAVRRSLEEAGEYLAKHQVSHVLPKNMIGTPPDNMIPISAVENQLLSIDEAAHALLSHANEIALIHGEDHDGYQRFMTDAKELRRIEVGLRDTLESMARASRQRATTTNRKAKQ